MSDSTFDDLNMHFAGDSVDDEEDYELESNSDSGSIKRRKTVIIGKSGNKNSDNCKEFSKHDKSKEKGNDSRDAFIESNASKKKRKRREKEKMKEAEREKDKKADIIEGKNRVKEMPKIIRPVLKVKQQPNDQNILSDQAFLKPFHQQPQPDSSKLSCCMKLMIILTVISLAISFAWLWESGALIDIPSTGFTNDDQSDLSSTSSNVYADQQQMEANYQRAEETFANLDVNYVPEEAPLKQSGQNNVDQQEQSGQINVDQQVPVQAYNSIQSDYLPTFSVLDNHHQIDEHEQREELLQSTNQRSDVPIQSDERVIVVNNLPSQMSPESDKVSSSSVDNNLESNEKIENQPTNGDLLNQWQNQELNEQQYAQARAYAQVLADEMRRLSEQLEAGNEKNLNNNENDQQSDQKVNRNDQLTMQELPKDENYFW